MSLNSAPAKFKLRQLIVLALVVFWLVFVLYYYAHYHEEHVAQFQALKRLAVDVLLFLIVAVSALGTGGRLLSLVGFKFDRFGEELLFASAIGFGVASYAMLIFGFLGLLYWWAGCALLISLFLFGVSKIKEYVNPLVAKTRNEIKILWSQPLTAFVAAIICFQLVMNIGDCLTPPYEWDTLAYSLGCQNLYVKAHRFVHLPFIHQSYYTCGVELIYALGLLLNSDIFAQLLHCHFGFLTLLAVYAFGTRYSSRTVGIVAALIFYTCPVIVWFSGVGKSDLGADFYSFLAVCAVLRWKFARDDPQRPRWLLLSCILLGLAIHVSYRGLVLLAAAVLYLLFILVFDRSETVRAKLAALALVVVIASAIGAPWFIRNAYLTGGNPFYPYFTNRFNSAKANYFDSLILELKQKQPKPATAPGAARWTMLKKRLYFLSLPFWDFTILGRNYDFVRFNAKITPLYLCLVPLLLFCRKTPPIRIVLAIALSYIVLQQLMRVEHLRYLSPVFPLLAILAGYVALEGFAGFRWGKAIHTFLLLLVLAVTLSLVWVNFVVFYRAANISYFLNMENRDAFLARRSSSYYCLAYANTYFPEKTTLLLLGDERIYYSYYPAIPLTARRFAELMRGYNLDVEHLHKLLRSLGVTHLLYNPFHHRFFEQNQDISDTLEEVLEQYKATHLDLVIEKSGFELYELHD